MKELSFTCDREMVTQNFQRADVFAQVMRQHDFLACKVLSRRYKAQTVSRAMTCKHSVPPDAVKISSC